jgi:transposase-like protein
MSKARVVITAVVVEGRSQAEVAREYNVSPGWVSKLVARYRIDGDKAFEPRSRRPRRSPQTTPTATIELILELRRRLTAIQQHGTPWSTLTDNGMVFTTRLSGGKGGRNGFEAELVRQRTIQKNSRPNHPTTCGKVERFQQTLKHWLRAQPQPNTITQLQHLLDTFTELYNHHRPHRSLPHHATPATATAYTTRPKATPGQHTDNPHWRVRHDRITDGRVSLRIAGQMHHIGLGRTLDGTRVILLIADLDIRVVHAATGEIIRALTIDPQRRYHGTGKPPGGPKGPRKPKRSEPK